MSRVAELVSLVGRTKYDGSSVAPGVTYQNIPMADIPFHRGKSDWRAERICELVDVAGKSVLDLGCSVGTMSSVFKEKGASSVVGVDHDEDSINLAREIHGENVRFIKADISQELITELGRFDVVVWTSQFMWMLKQRGMEYALDTLFLISKSCDTLIFETAGTGDGSAGVDLPVGSIMPMLIKNTCFQSIVDTGPWGDEWATRNVFVCKKPALSWVSELTRVDRVDRKTVKKTYKIDGETGARGREIMTREIYFLSLVSGYDNFPTLVSLADDGFTMGYEGLPALWIPEKDLNSIKYFLDKWRIIHRDIRPENIVWNGEHCILVDFSYAVHPEDVTNYHYDLGGAFKCPSGFDDEYSLRKTQTSLMLKSLERENKR